MILFLYYLIWRTMDWIYYDLHMRTSKLLKLFTIKVMLYFYFWLRASFGVIDFHLRLSTYF